MDEQLIKEELIKELQEFNLVEIEKLNKGNDTVYLRLHNHPLYNTLRISNHAPREGIYETTTCYVNTKDYVMAATVINVKYKYYYKTINDIIKNKPSTQEIERLREMLQYRIDYNLEPDTVEKLKRILVEVNNASSSIEVDSKYGKLTFENLEELKEFMNNNNFKLHME